MHLDAGGHTDKGRVRANNEDAYCIEPSLGLYVVSDGMGGEAYGEIASALAVETVVTYCHEADNGRATPPSEPPDAKLSEESNRLVGAITAANQRILDSASANPQQRGMGATVVAARVHAGRLNLVHVGDSRAYLLRGGNLEQLTSDHSLVAEQVRRGVMTPQEAETSALQSVLIRALGIQTQVQVDASERMLLAGDVLLLCSDGLTRMVMEPEIASTLMTIQPAQAAALRLVELANENGGADNITVIVVRMLPDSGGMLKWLREWSKRSGT